MIKLVLILLFTLIPLSAQTHSAVLSWTAPTDAVATSTYSVYRATGLCSGTPVFSKIATAVIALTYTDTTVTPGNYCYTVTQVQGGAESPQAVAVVATVVPRSPTGVNVVPN